MEQWADLQQKSSDKSAKLADAERLQSFMLKAKELVGFNSIIIIFPLKIIVKL